MSMRDKKVLGIAFSTRSLRVTEVHAGAGEPRLVRTGELQFENLSLQDGAVLGKRLAEFLKENHFTASACVAGIPAQWLMLKEKAVPPAAPEVLASVLKIQAERDFSLEPSSLALDYLPGTISENGQAVVLVATLSERVEQIKLVARTAGLKLQTITVTALALSSVSREPSVLYTGPNGIEMTSRSSSGLPLVRHVAPAAALSSSGAAPELRRMTALHQSLGGAREWSCWDDLGIEPQVLNTLASEAGWTLNNRAGLKIASAVDQADGRSSGSAALALCRLKNDSEIIDFLHSRLEVKPPAKISRKAIWAAAAAALLLLSFGYLINDWRQLESEVADLRRTRDDMKDNVETAKAFISRVNYTRTWYEQRPNYLECLRTLTLSFPEEGRVWTTNLTLREDLRGVLTGRAVDQKSVLDVLDKLKSNKALADVKMLHMRGVAAKSTEMSFAVSFSYLGGELK
ncbi:MAG TPA: hypothetical protein VEK08_15810 [Planctomycetota bacterium]|nr:hypothetical protein [Planctomycetota bacterium]